jgi:hypothetical protein
MSKIQGNKSQTKAITELIAKFPQASIKTEINEADAHFYHILACSVSITRGTNVELKYRIVTTSERDYNKQQSMGIFNAQSYLCDEIHLLHDPILYAKEQQPKATRKPKQGE